MSRFSDRVICALLLLPLLGAGAVRAQSQAAVTASSGVTKEADPLVLPAGTAVTLILDQDITARNAKLGQEVRAYVAGEIRVAGKVVIPQRAPAAFMVTRSQNGLFVGQPDKLAIEAKYATAIDGSRITLTGEFALAGEDRMVESLASAQIVGCLFFLVPGDKVVMGKGTGWTATLSQTFALQPRASTGTETH
jgi:hypothetical protein